MPKLPSVGVLFILIGVALLLFRNFISDRTAVAYFWLSGSFNLPGPDRLNYNLTGKFYLMAGVCLILVGVVIWISSQ